MFFVGRKQFQHRVIFGLAMAIANQFSWAYEPDTLPTPLELKKLSLEELMDIKVTVVSKQPEKLAEAPSAVQVITQDDIRRSGAHSLPEVLRLASNLQVAQMDARQWAITARGMNMSTSNKLLVMVDGRSIYTPLYAGVFWDAQNLPLDNIERIEVVSGPGGTLWGANAVNGVINIVTKGAEYTLGGLVGADAGASIQDAADVRYGGKPGPRVFYRVNGQRQDFNSTDTLGGGDGKNGWDFTQGGMRMDYLPNPVNRLTLMGNMSAGNYATLNTTADGQYLIARWTRNDSSASDLALQAYFDREARDIPNQFGEDLKTYDFDFHHRLPMLWGHAFIWGGGYRIMQDEVTNSKVLAFLPAHKILQLFNGFIEDQITIFPERVKLTLGSKLEHNDYSGWEVMPSSRLAWTPDDRQTIWGAVSRAVRSPSRIDAEFFVPAPPVPPLLAGGPDFMAEILTAYEVGYRLKPRPNISLSLATFYNWYDDLRILEGSAANPAVFVLTNGATGEVRGAELSGSVQATPWWRVHGGYTYLQEEFWTKPGHAAITQSSSQGNDPGHQFNVQTGMDLPGGFEVNAAARYVSELPNPVVPYYATFDLGVVWERRGLRISVYGQNLAEERHREFANGTNSQEIPRSATGRISWRF